MKTFLKINRELKAKSNRNFNTVNNGLIERITFKDTLVQAMRSYK